MSSISKVNLQRLISATFIDAVSTGIAPVLAKQGATAEAV